MNLSTVLLLGGLVCAVALAVRSVRRHRGGCAGCPGCDACREREQCSRPEKRP